MTIHDLDFPAVKGSIDMLCSYSHTGIGGRDATMLYAMKKAGIARIMTHDEAFKKTDWVEVVDSVEA